MSYMPESTPLIFTETGSVTLESLRTYLENWLTPLVSGLEFAIDSGFLWITCGSSGASLGFLELPDPGRLLERYPHLDTGSLKPLELRSGPNHDYSYFPIFYAVDLVLMHYQGIFLWGRDNRLLSLEDRADSFRDCVETLSEMIDEEGDYDCQTLECAESLRKRILELFPPNGE